MSTKGKVYILSLENQSEKSPQKYKGELHIEGDTYTIAFSPRVKGDITGSHIANFPSDAIAKHGISINKSLPQSSLADALTSKGAIEVDLTPKGSADPSKPRAPRTPKTEVFKSWANFTLTPEAVILEVGVGPNAYKHALTEADRALIETFEMVVKARAYYRDHIGEYSPKALANALAVIETLDLPADMKATVIASTTAKYAIPSIPEAAAKYDALVKAEAEAKAKASAEAKVEA